MVGKFGKLPGGFAGGSFLAKTKVWAFCLELELSGDIAHGIVPNARLYAVSPEQKKLGPCLSRHGSTKKKLG